MIAKIVFTLSIVLFSGLVSMAQTTRYFEFKSPIGSGIWQDTSFIAAATDQVLIDSVLANLNRPYNQRKFIAGPIDYGNDGYNHNASHWFLWHFIPDQWDLKEVTMELCDGRPHSEVDSNVTFWVGSVGVYCPWSAKPVREVTGSVGFINQVLENSLSIFPNPARDKVTVNWDGNQALFVTVYNATGQELLSANLSKNDRSIDMSGLNRGIYFLKATDGTATTTSKIVVGN